MKMQRKNDRKQSIAGVKTAPEPNVIDPSSEQVKLFAIAVKMKKTELTDKFIVDAVRTALEFEGVADLMNLWMDEEDQDVRDEIVADVQEMIDECAPKEGNTLV